MRGALFSLILALGGCAGTTIHPISYNDVDPKVEGENDSEINGFRYYEGAHFLIVYTDGKGGLKSEVKFLPDVTRKFSIDPYAYFSKNETTLTFLNGMLTSSKSVIDETAIPKAAIIAAGKIALATIAAGNKAGGNEATYLPEPVLFKIRINPETGTLELIQGKEFGTKIEVTLQEADK